MLLPLLAALAAPASAASMGTALLDAPVPAVTDLDLMPEPGAWPCTVTIAVEGGGAVSDVTVARGCPSGLVDTAKALGRAWTWSASAGPHAETVTVRFHVLSATDAEPKPVTTADDLTYLLRPWDVLEAPPTSEAAPTAPYRLDKGPKVKLPGNAEALRLGAGTCLVRLTVGTDGKVTDAKASRCLDVLAGPAVAAAKKLKFTVAGATAPATFDLPVRFAPAE